MTRPSRPSGRRPEGRRPRSGAHRESGDSHRRPPHTFTRRSRTNPASVAIAVVGIGIVIGLAFIISRKSPPLIKISEHPKVAADPDAALKSKIAALRSTRLPPKEARRAAEDLYADAKLPETQNELKILINRFAEKEAIEERKNLARLKPEVLKLAAAGEFAAAHKKLDRFENEHERLLNRPLGAVRVLKEEILSLRTKIENARKERFKKDFALLKKAVAVDDLDGANDAAERIYIYGTDAMKKETRAIWKPFFARIRDREAAKRKVRTESEKAAAPAVAQAPEETDSEAGTAEEDFSEGDDTTGEEETSASEEEDDFFGGGDSSSDNALPGCIGHGCFFRNKTFFIQPDNIIIKG